MNLSLRNIVLCLGLALFAFTACREDPVIDDPTDPHTELPDDSITDPIIEPQGLPTIKISGDSILPPLSKTEYRTATFHCHRDSLSVPVQIRGRGNTTWYLPKQPFRLLFDDPHPLLGMPADKSWVLLANYYDKTMLRNATAFYLSELSRLQYTPRSRFVELTLNDSCFGTYQLTEKLKLSPDRIDMKGKGFLLEVDAKHDEDDLYFFTPFISYSPFCIKEPDSISADDFEYIRSFVLEAEDALHSDYSSDPLNGWRKYLDEASFVDWYLIQEIAKNQDATMFTSCFMTLEKGGKLKMGPVWDFDLAFGNVGTENISPEGLWIYRSPWFYKLCHDPYFMAQVKERFNYFFSLRYEILRFIDQNAEYLRSSADKNETLWHTMDTEVYPGVPPRGDYLDEVAWLKDWIILRMCWLKQYFDQ